MHLCSRLEQGASSTFLNVGESLQLFSFVLCCKEGHKAEGVTIPPKQISPLAHLQPSASLCPAASFPYPAPSPEEKKNLKKEQPRRKRCKARCLLPDPAVRARDPSHGPETEVEARVADAIRQPPWKWVVVSIACNQARS